MVDFAKMHVAPYHLQIEQVFSRLAELIINGEDDEPDESHSEPVVFCLFMIENRNQPKKLAVGSFCDVDMNQTTSIEKDIAARTLVENNKVDTDSTSCAVGYCPSKSNFVPMDVNEDRDHGKADEGTLRNRGIFRGVDRNEVEVIQTMAHCYPWLLGDICSIFATLPDVWQLRVEILFILGELMFGYLSKVESFLNVNTSRSPLQHDRQGRTSAAETVKMYFQLLDAVCARASRGKKCIADLIKQSLTSHGHQPVKLILKSKMMHSYLKNSVSCPVHDKKFNGQLFFQLTNVIPGNCDLATIFSSMHTWKSFVGFLQKMYDLNAESFAAYAMCPDQNDLLIVLFDDIDTVQRSAANQSASTPWNNNYSRCDESISLANPSDSTTSQSTFQDWRTAKDIFYGSESKICLLQQALKKTHITQSYMYGFIHDISRDVTCTARLLQNLTTINGNMETTVKDLCETIRSTMLQAMPNDLLLGALNIGRLAENFGIASSRGFMEFMSRYEPVKMSFKGIVDVLLNRMRKRTKHAIIDEYVFLHRMCHLRSALCEFNIFANVASRTLQIE